MSKQIVIRFLIYSILFIIAISFTIDRVHKSGMQDGCESAGLKLFYMDGNYGCDNLTRIVEQAEMNCIDTKEVKIESLS